MKTINKTFVLLCWLIICALPKAKAQVSTAQDLQQLLLDIEKLTQFKAILGDLEAGYTILTQGYAEVRDISEGNFNLHSAFLTSLMAVSPAVRQYGRVADILTSQASIVSEYKAAWQQVQSGGHFTAQELLYLNGVFTSLLNQSVDNLTNLTNILTANTLRMSDAERLQAIDHLYADTQHKLVFLRHFGSELQLMQVQRQKEQNDANTLNHLF